MKLTFQLNLYIEKKVKPHQFRPKICRSTGHNQSLRKKRIQKTYDYKCNVISRRVQVTDKKRNKSNDMHTKSQVTLTHMLFTDIERILFSV